MQVLHLVWNLIRGGTEGQCARVAMELSGRGHQHQVMVFRKEGFFLDQVERVCGPVDEIGIRGMARISTFTAVRRLARRIKRDNIQILHAWDADAAIFGQFAAAVSGVPFITSRRDLGHIYPPHKVWLMKRADLRARAVVANAAAIVKEFAPRGIPENKFKVIPNILNLQEFDQLAGNEFSRSSELPGGPKVVMVSRLDPEKDIATFIYAAELILKAHPDASFVIAGDGVERQRLETMAAQHDLQAKICFLGDITEVPSLLMKCRVGVLTPSKNEGLSNTILEYMAAGLPVVATDCGGNRELVNPPSGGAVVAPGDAAALAKEILNFIRDAALAKRVGESNRKVISERFQPGTVGEQFETLYWDVLKK